MQVDLVLERGSTEISPLQSFLISKLLFCLPLLFLVFINFNFK